MCMGQTPTPRQAIGLQQLARQLRASVADTSNLEYVGLFLSAALALEARARCAAPDMPEHAGISSRTSGGLLFGSAKNRAVYYFGAVRTAPGASMALLRPGVITR